MKYKTFALKTTKHCVFLINFLNVYSFLRDRERQRERERERTWVREGQRKRETQNPKQLQALSCQNRARQGARTYEPWDHDLSRSQMPNWLSHPGTTKYKLENSFWKKYCERTKGNYYVHCTWYTCVSDEGGVFLCMLKIYSNRFLFPLLFLHVALI